MTRMRGCGGGPRRPVARSRRASVVVAQPALPRVRWAGQGPWPPSTNIQSTCTTRRPPKPRQPPQPRRQPQKRCLEAVRMLLAAGASCAAEAARPVSQFHPTCLLAARPPVKCGVNVAPPPASSLPLPTKRRRGVAASRRQQDGCDAVHRAHESEVRAQRRGCGRSDIGMSVWGGGRISISTGTAAQVRCVTRRHA